VLRLKRRKNQIDTLDAIVDTKQRRNNESYEEKDLNQDIGPLIRVSSQVYVKRH